MKETFQAVSRRSFRDSSEYGGPVCFGNDCESADHECAGVLPAVDRSADFQSAVSPNCIRQDVGPVPRVDAPQRLAEWNSAKQQSATQRYDEAAGRYLPRYRASSDFFQRVSVLCSLLLLAATILRGQDVPSDRVSVPFRDPARPGVVKVTLMTGAITVKGYDGKEVVVEARLRGGKSSKKKKTDDQAEGLKRIEVATTGLTVEEEDNVVSVNTGAMGHAVDVSVQVPTSTSLKLGCMNDGDILVENVTGEIEANNLNGSVALTKVSGVVVAHSVNGAVRIQMDQVTPEKPMSFSTFNGDIDVTLPPDIKAKVKLETQNGVIYSDFEIGLDKNPQPPAVEDGRKDGGRYRIVFDKGVVGTINGGGAEIQFKTINGHIHIRKGKQ